jgi:class 3 adenylate cyclase/DNA-binding beta-propeller fold protein YncE
MLEAQARGGAVLADLPTGTVTFLFTDLEGSTRLLKGLGRDRYARLLEEQQGLLRSAFEEAGGQEIDTQGDAFFVAFGSAADALRAAEAGQRALVAHRWPKGARVRVRMGIHTGEPALGSERYVGLGVHRAARICSAGHGGQILLSKTTHDLLQDEESSEAAFKDLAEQRLKDLDRPERIFQLIVPGLPSDFPPLRTMEAQPAEALPFAGKEVELAKAAQASVEGAGRRRRRSLLAAALLATVAAAVAIPVLAFRGGESQGSESQVTTRVNSVAVIDPRTNGVVADLPVGEWPGPITAASGAIWVGNEHDKTVSRIDPASREVVGTPIGFGHPIDGLAAGGGYIWVASWREGVVRRIDPSLNSPVGGDRIVFRRAAARPPPTPIIHRRPVAIVFGNGSLWVGDQDYGVLRRIDPDTHRVVGRIKNVDPQALAFGDGIVWMVSAQDEEVIKVDANTASILIRQPVQAYPHGIVVGEEAVWVAHAPGGGREQTVSELDPLTGEVRRTIDLGAHLSDSCSCYITAMTAKDGVIWVANPLDHTVTRINEATHEKEIIPVSVIPLGLTATGGAIWATISPSRNF